jgi:hypothetical protein
LILLFNQRNKPETKPVSKIVLFEIGGVDEERNLILKGEGFDVFSPGFEEGTNHASLANGKHSLEPCEAGPPDQPEKNRFHLIIGIMTQGDLLRLIFFEKTSEKVKANATCSILQGESSDSLEFFDIELSIFKGKTQTARFVSNQFRFFFGLPWPEPMVDVGCNEKEIPFFAAGI